jgi:GNAT superfamily N-acetyltransferase
MPNPASTSAQIHVAAASRPSDWIAARVLIGQLVEWLEARLELDVRHEQHDSEDELDRLEGFYAEPYGTLLLGYLDGRPCGTTGVHLMSSERAELRRVWVAPEARGIGLASALLRTGIETARGLGAHTVVLETVSGVMDTAIGMYARAGFRPIQPYSVLGETFPNALTLGLQLSAE